MIYFSSPLVQMGIRGQGKVRGHAQQQKNIHGGWFLFQLDPTKPALNHVDSSISHNTQAKCCSV